MLRPLVALLLPLALWAADEGVPATPPEPATPPVPMATGVPFRLQYNGGQLALKAGELSHLDGGVEAWYEQVHLHCQTLEWTQTVYPGSTEPILDALRLTAGPESHAPDRVLLDTRQSRLPLVGFRGVLTPARIDVVRRPADAADPTHVRWKVTLAKPGYFAGDLLTKTGWAAHAGWAEEIELDVVADVSPTGIASPRFSAIHFFGRQASNPKDRVRCRLDRLTKPLARPEDLADTPAEAAQFGYQAMSLTIAFDLQGRYDYTVPGQMAMQYGIVPADTPMRTRSALGAGK